MMNFIYVNINNKQNKNIYYLTQIKKYKILFQTPNFE